MTENDQVIESLVSEACISLFQDYSLPLCRGEIERYDEHTAMLYAGAVGFTGEQMRGTLLLATSREPLGRTSPSGEGSLREWIAELSNQLLGRIKNKLIPYGVTLHLSTPIVLRGQHIAPVSRCELAPFIFTCDGGVVCVWFDAEVDPTIKLNECTPPADLLGEGEGMLF